MIETITLTLKNIWKSYEGKKVLKGCSATFDKRCIYVLMGPNGSGKSTFFRICSLLESPDKGEISYLSESKPLPHDMTLKRSITLLLPNIGVFNRSVFNNVAFGLRIRKLAKREIQKRVLEVLEVVGLAHKQAQNALTLSSGEIQRIGVARAMVVQPRIFFLDEPTVSIDQKNVEIVEDIILHMKQKGKTTIVLATHDQSQADRLADRVLHINDGILTS